MAEIAVTVETRTRGAIFVAKCIAALGPLIGDALAARLAMRAGFRLMQYRVDGGPWRSFAEDAE